MKLLLTCALLFGSLAISLPPSFGNQKREDKDLSIQVGDIKMAYRIYGSGYPLVMVMGYGSTMKLWEPDLIRRLSSSFQVILFDHRGIGNTETGRRPFTLEQFADDTAGLLEALGIKQAHMLGWSMGGLITEEVALRHPSRVNKLVLYAAHCHPGLFPPSPEVIKKLTDTSGTPAEQGMRFISLLFPPAWLQSHGERVKEIFYRPMGNIPIETMGQQSMAIGAWKGCCDRLGAITNPTLVLAGNEDLLVPPQNASYLAEKIPKARLVLYENTGHGLMFQDPERFGRQVIEFLR
jgi:pimeloyl-ACP methyl ester carboxylesterase